MSPIVLLTPSLEGTRMGPCSLGWWMQDLVRKSLADIRAVIWFAPMWLVKVCWEVVKSTNPYGKYPQG